MHFNYDNVMMMLMMLMMKNDAFLGFLLVVDDVLLAELQLQFLDQV